MPQNDEQGPLKELELQFDSDSWTVDFEIFLTAEIDAIDEKGAIAVAQYFDGDGAAIAPPYEGWATGNNGRAFRYVKVCPAPTSDIAASDKPPENEASKSRHAADKDRISLGSPELSPEKWSVRLPRRAAAGRFELFKWRGRNEIKVDRFIGKLSSLPAQIESESGGNPLVVRASCSDSEPLMLKLELADLGDGDPRGAIFTTEFYDGKGLAIDKPVEGLLRSDFEFYFNYISTVPATSRQTTAVRHYLLFPPADAKTVECRFRRWNDRHPFKIRSEPNLVLATPAILTETAKRLVNEMDAPEVRTFVGALIDYARSRGQLLFEQKMLQLLVGTQLADRSSKRLPVVDGLIQEMQTDWLPCHFGGVSPQKPECPERRVMSLVKVCRPYENSGGAVRNEKVLGHLKSGGWDPYAVTPLGYPGEVERGHIPARTDVDKVPHLHFNIPQTSFQRTRPDHLLRYETALLSSVFSKFGGMLIHAVSGYRGYEIALKALALKSLYKVPVLYDFRSLHEHTWAPVSLHATEAPLTQMRAAQENRCVAESDHCVVISQAMKSILIDRGANPTKISVIPNGVDAAKFSGREQAGLAIRAELNISAEAPVYGYISNMSEREGHSDLLKAHKILLSSFPNGHCLIVGTGPRLRALKKLVRELGVEESVTFTGEVSHDRIADYYAAFDVFVIPRINDYASDHVTPLKPFEAMASRIPIVMSDLPVTREVLGGNFELGVRSIPGSPDSIAQSVKMLLESPDKAQRYQSNAYKWVSRERDWSKIVGRYDEIYRQLSRVE